MTLDEGSASRNRQGSFLFLSTFAPGSKKAAPGRLTVLLYQTDPASVNPVCPCWADFCILHNYSCTILYSFTSCKSSFSVLYYSQKGWYQCTGKTSGSKQTGTKKTKLLKEVWFRHRSNSLREWRKKDHAAEWSREQKNSSIQRKRG